jgi:hypothetical protein
MVRAVAAALVVLLIGSGVNAAVVCVGWQTTPSARAACCAAAQHACPDQMSADDCCARGEQSQQQFAKMEAAIAPAAPSAIVVAHSLHQLWPSQLSARVWFERDVQKHPHRPPFLSSVLLI